MTQVVESYTWRVAGRPRVTYEEYLALTNEEHSEWVNGEVVPLMAVGLQHNTLGFFLLLLLGGFLERKPLGRLLYEPFQMKTGPDLPGRSPDLMFLALANLHRLRRNHLEGPADLVIEVLSPSTGRIDRGEKFAEYEAGGVREYWILDPERKVATFYQLLGGAFQQIRPVRGLYRSSAMPGLAIRVEWLWSQPAVQPLLDEMPTLA